MSDPGTSYRERSEIQEVREKKDCLHSFKKLILDSNLAKEEELKAIEVFNQSLAEMRLKVWILQEKTKIKVNKETEKAEKDHPPPLEELTADTYVIWPDKVRMARMLEWVPYKTIAHYKSSAK